MPTKKTTTAKKTTPAKKTSTKTASPKTTTKKTAPKASAKTTPEKSTETEAKTVESNDSGLSKTQEKVIAALYRAKAPMSRKDIKTACEFSTGLTKVIGHVDPEKRSKDCLVSLGLCDFETHQNEKGREQLLVVLTKDGIAKAKELK